MARQALTGVDPRQGDDQARLAVLIQQPCGGRAGQFDDDAGLLGVSAESDTYEVAALRSVGQALARGHGAGGEHGERGQGGGDTPAASEHRLDHACEAHGPTPLTLNWQYRRSRWAMC